MKSFVFSVMDIVIQYLFFPCLAVFERHASSFLYFMFSSAIFVGIYTLEFDAFLGWNIVLFLFESHSHAIISYNSTNPFV